MKHTKVSPTEKKKIPAIGYFVGKPKDSEDTFSFVTPINFRENGEMLHY